MISPYLYESLIDNLAEGLIYVDLSMSVVVYNQAAEKMTSIPSSVAIGRSVTEIFGDNLWIAEAVEKTLKTRTIVSEYEGSIHRRLSTPTKVVLTASPVFSSDGQHSGVVVLLRDVTAIKSLELDSIRKEKLAFIGTFATSIAHEVKNPLGGLRGMTQLLSRKIGEELREYTDIMIKEVDRINNIVEETLNFARSNNPDSNPVNIHMILDDVLIMAAPSQTISLVREYDPSLPPISGDSKQLVQVLLNLIKNAIEAIDETCKTGEIRVKTRMVTDFHLIEEGYRGIQMISIEIIDNGCGIPQENMEKIFAPFFTTKAAGSGLGIAVAFRIIKEHSGIFKIESSPSVGTKVLVYLPVAEKHGAKDE